MVFPPRFEKKILTINGNTARQTSFERDEQPFFRTKQSECARSVGSLITSQLHTINKATIQQQRMKQMNNIFLVLFICIVPLLQAQIPIHLVTEDSHYQAGCTGYTDSKYDIFNQN